MTEGQVDEQNKPSSSRKNHVSLSNIQPEPRRWFILIGFSLFAFANLMPCVTVSLIINETKQYYDIGNQAYIEFTNVYAYFYIAFSYFFSNYMSDHLAPCLMIATSMNTLGGFLKWYAGSNYTLAIIGQCCCGFALAGQLQVPPVIAERWFGAHERFWALVVGTYAAYAGWLFGYISPAYYMATYSLDTAFSKMYLHQMIILAIPTVVLAFSVRSKPVNPPNVGALLKTDHKTASLLETMQKLLPNRRYMLNMLCIGFAIGASFTITAVTSYVYDDYKYSKLQFEYLGLAFLGTGIVGAFIGTAYLEARKSANYDAVLKVYITIGIIGFLGSAIGSGSTLLPFWLVILLNICLGLGFIAILPFAFESLIEATFPLPESVSVGNAFFTAQVFSIIMNDLAIADFIGKGSFWFLTLCSLPATIYVLGWYKTDYERTKEEHAKVEEMVEEEQLLMNPNPQTPQQVL